MTQDGLGQVVGLDRTAISRLESGERKLSVSELIEIAKAIGLPLSFFVNAPVPAAVSRRSDTAHAHETTQALDTELVIFASDVRTLLQMQLIGRVERAPNAKTPTDHAAAEGLARETRSRLNVGQGPIQDLSDACQQLGLYTYSAPFGHGGPDGGCVEVDDATKSLAVAVINGDAPPGRRRMTLAHELGHWLCGDAYDLQASQDSEKMVNSFAIHFLAPRAGVQTAWNERAGLTSRDRALAIGAEFRLSWSATISQLRNLDLIDQGEHRTLSENEPRKGDFLRLALSWSEELACPHVSSGFAAACINGYASGQLTADRTVELLRGTLTAADLPQQNPRTLDDLRRSFSGHGE